MKTTKFLLTTLKEVPADAELISHKLMLRSGMIRKVGAGIYNWLPLGLRVLQKVAEIVRKEMNAADALEILMPNVVPSELWSESGRWQQYGPELLRITDRHEREFCFGPTHEEVVVDIARRELKSYKQLPINFYQIQTKFRDEIRPRFGVMRAREFLMKDAYSFDLDKDGMRASYEKMFTAYNKIFTALGLKYCVVEADTGNIGGNFSHEFQVLAESGEDLVAYCENSNYAANLELAKAILPHENKKDTVVQPLKKVATPNKTTIKDVCEFLNLSENESIKTLFVKGKNDPVVALMLRGNDTLNIHKAQKHPLIASPLEFVDDELILQVAKCRPGYLGPINLNAPIIVDTFALNLNNFVCGANEDNFHYINANWERDVSVTDLFDLRTVQEGDLSPCGNGILKIARGIEVGHIFQLGTKYSVSMDATVLDSNGKKIIMEMGCYGIGVSRVVAAAIEQNNDDYGIIWPDAIAPFNIAIIPIAMHKSVRVREGAEALYQKLIASRFDVLFDDRSERPGVMFSDMDLIGIPHQLIISERTLDAGVIEYKNRKENKTYTLKIESVMDFLQKNIYFKKGMYEL